MSQLHALVVKNVWIKRRSPCSTLMEFAYPVMFGVIIVAIGLSGGVYDLPATTRGNITTFPLHCNGSCFVAALSDDVEAAALFSSPIWPPHVTVRLFSNESEMIDAGAELGVLPKWTLVGPDYLAPLPPTNHTKAPTTNEPETDDDKNSTATSAVGTFEAYGPPVGVRLIALSDLVHRFRLSKRGVPTSGPSRFSTLPTPPAVVPQTSSTNLWQVYFPIIFLFVVQGGSIVVSYEKERKLRDHLELYGVSKFKYFLSHVITQYLIGLIDIAVLMIILFASNTVQIVSPGFFLAFYLVYLLAMMAVSFLLSELGSPRSVAIISILYVGASLGLVYLCTLVLLPLSSSVSWAIPIVLSLLTPVVPLGLAFSWAAFAEDAGQQVDWIGGSHPPVLALCLLVFNVASFAFIGYYYFNSQRRGACFCCRRRAQQPRANVDDGDEESVKLSRRSKEAGIQVRNLSKSYGGSNVKALDNVSFDARQGQVTTLIGINGSGKTTCINAILGILNADEGDIFVNNRSVQTDSDLILQSVGVAPQHDALWEMLTVRQHVELFARLRSVPDRVDEYIEKVDLQDAADTLAKNLSGGMKRRLSLALAIIGDPEIVILDEPSAGLDPSAQHDMFSVIRSLKSTVLMTTHSMLEAETLSNHIVILRRGKVCAQGSLLDLSQQFGLGYTLTASLEDKDLVERLVSSLFPLCEPSVAGHEVHFPVGFEATLFPELFRRLESTEVSLKAGSLRSLFLRIGDQEGE